MNTLQETNLILEEIDFLEMEMARIDDKLDQWADEKRQEIYDRMDYLEWVLMIKEENLIMEKKQQSRAHLTLINGEKE